MDHSHSQPSHLRQPHDLEAPRTPRISRRSRLGPSRLDAPSPPSPQLLPHLAHHPLSDERQPPPKPPDLRLPSPRHYHIPPRLERLHKSKHPPIPHLSPHLLHNRHPIRSQRRPDSSLHSASSLRLRKSFSPTRAHAWKNVL